MSKTNTLIDKLIFIKDRMTDRAEKDVINEACRELKRIDEKLNSAIRDLGVYAKCSVCIHRPYFRDIPECMNCMYNGAYKPHFVSINWKWDKESEVDNVG